MSDEAEVLHYIMTSIISNLFIAPIFGIIILGFITRFMRNLNL